MTAPLGLALEEWFTVFCRIGACFMMMPGFGADRLPPRIKLYIAIAVSAPIAMNLWPTLSERIAAQPAVSLAMALLSETTIGILIGLTCRMFLFAAETMFTAVTLAIGLGNAMGAPINESEPVPALASFVILGATTLIFAMDLHLELVRGVSLSYEVAQPLMLQTANAMLREFTTSLDKAFIVVFRIVSPFLIFGLISNIAIAFLNKMTPQVMVYFAVTPALIFGGLAFLYSLIPETLGELSLEYASWLTKG